MRTLYYMWLDPFSCKVRMTLHEKALEFEKHIEKSWERRTEFLAMNPAGDVPVLVEEDGTILSNAQVICEYLNEVYSSPNILGDNPTQRSEVRRLISWFDFKFYREVTQNIVGEKFTKCFYDDTPLNKSFIEAGLANIHYHLDYIGFLTEKRTWLAGAEFSLADISAAAQLYCIDFLGDVDWNVHPSAKNWFDRVKARGILEDIMRDEVPHRDDTSLNVVRA